MNQELYQSLLKKAAHQMPKDKLSPYDYSLYMEILTRLTVEECARLCEEVAKDSDLIAKSEFVTDTGRHIHQGMWGGATNCKKIIKHQFGIKE